MISSNSMAGFDLICHHLASRPDSKILGGKSFMLGGSTDFTEEAPGIRSGDLSRIMTANLPWWFRNRSFPSQELASVTDWELKVGRMVRALDGEDIRLIGVADQAPEDGMRLMLDTGLFYEFVPVDELESSRPTRHWAGTVQRGINYALVVSSCAGLWSCVLGNTVELVSRKPLRLKVTGRTSYTMSAFGEYLIAKEIEAAVRDGGVAIGADVRDWSVGAVHASDDDSRGGHLYIVEFAGEVTSKARLAHFARTLDAALCATSEDYEAHRSEGFGMNVPEAIALPPGGFAEWMKSRGQLGGQHKVPRIINDAELFDKLCGYADGNPLQI